MDVTMKFRQIVENARLDAETAQHLLSLPKVLPSMPKAGRQGHHRQFTLRQGVRLSLCTHLVKAAIQPHIAGLIVARFEESLRRKSGDTQRSQERRYVSKPKAPWILTVDERRYCRLWRDQQYDDGLAIPEDFWDAETRKVVTRNDDDWLVRYQVNMTDLEFKLWSSMTSSK